MADSNRRGRTIALCLAFFASGASALLLETLWFRQVGLLLGNSVWASSLVVSSFMAGLGIGNALSARLAARARRPLVAYAGLEIAIAIAGVGLVFALPHLAPALGPGLGRLAASTLVLNATRFAIAFGLLVVPATAMGATLPLLSRALSADDPHFGRVLGRLYGWNTLGGVLGALAGEALLVERLGIRGTSLVAGALDLLAAGAALALATRAVDTPASSSPRHLRLATPAALAAFVCGMLVLALEVLWFRLLLLFAYGSSLAFAAMLAVVLLGIALGGLLGGLAAPRLSRPALLAPLLGLLAGAVTVVAYAALPQALGPARGPLASLAEIALPAAVLMLPTCLASGALFTVLGASLKAEGGEAAEAAGTLTLANTLGAMLGAPLAAFVLLPRLGVEPGLLVLAASFGLVALLTAPGALRGAGRSEKSALAACLAVFVGALALFPSGLWENALQRRALARWTSDGSRLVAFRESVTESLAYLARRVFGETVAVRLVTNGFSMSSSEVSGQRYMKLFVYWPVAVRPEPRRALLISYGVGMTARALADTRSLEQIDVVDISRDILEMGRHVFPGGGFPLDDPRMRVHVEDGRFFLLGSDARWDIVTSEPPPPKNAGVVSLYTREYFSLVRRHLAPGGVATYWLPVYQMTWDESRAVTRGFCDAFPDCSLWSGYGLEWMLAGTAGDGARPDVAAFARQWSDPQVAPTLAALGFDRPESLGATLLAGPERLADLTRGVAPVTDDFPLRLSPRPPALLDPRYLELMDAARGREAFAGSAAVRRLWPEELREGTLAAFDEQARLNAAMGWQEAGRPADLRTTAQLLRHATSRFTALVALRTSEAELRAAGRAVARGERGPELALLRAEEALVRRDYAGAAALLSEAEADPVLGPRASGLRKMAEDLASAAKD